MKGVYMNREELIKVIISDGWNEKTMQITRNVFVNEPTNRWSYYDFSKIFKVVLPIDIIITNIREAPHYEKHNDKCTYGYKNVLQETDHELNRKFDNPNELIEFWCGTSMTRGQSFLKSGDGYTMLEYPVVLHDGNIVNYGIQVMLSDNRANEYARTQANATCDVPAIIHGFIKAKYLYPENNGYEYAIPCEYYNKIINGECYRTY